jgi:DNA polymerase III delta subunit
MKIIVLHGENTEKSYERLCKFVDTVKNRSWEIIYLDESSLNIKEAISGVSLFEKERFFVLRNYLKLTKGEISWINKNCSRLSGTLIIYHEGILPLTFLKSLPNDAKIEEFKLTKTIWVFLEYLYPGNSENTVRKLHEVIKRDVPEFVFSVAAKHFRDLYWSKIDSSSIPYPSWRISKLKFQCSKFSESLLKEIIDDMAEIDIKAKTSKADLISSLDLLLIKKLK